MTDQRKPKVFIGIPTHDSRLDAGCAKSLIFHGVQDSILCFHGSSLLAHNFNTLLCNAIASGAEYFCLMHADVEPMEANWLKKLIWILEREKYSVLSVASPIKDASGDTSTALMRDGHDVERIPVAWTFERDEGVTEMFPDTFANGFMKGETLMVNTGLMLIKLSGINPVLNYFTITDAIQLVDGKYIPRNLPEDWNFSLMLARDGIRYGVTREILINHIGQKAYPNRVATESDGVIEYKR